MSDIIDSFSHITVTPAEEDDFVINAGVAKPDERAAKAQPLPADEANLRAVSASESQGAERLESRSAPKEQQPIEARSARSTRGKARSKVASEYHETTLEDLDSGPMSLTQKIVIVAAILCLIGAVTYYFLFMR